MDSSVAGLGGCPYAKSDAGNVCTENVLYMLEQVGVETGVDRQKVKEIGSWMANQINRKNVAV